jgi:hypothetical protein
MAHYAEVDSTGVVLRVLVVPDEQEHRGQDYLANDLTLGGTWIQCSYNGRIRKQYPGPGFTYDPAADVFVAPQPAASWTLDDNHDWKPPVPMPEWTEDHLSISWDEDTGSWVEVFRGD